MVTAHYDSRGLDTHGILLLARVTAGTITAAPTAVWAPIANVAAFNGPQPSLSFADTTEPDAEWKTFEPQQIDPGMLNLTIQYNPAMATHSLLLDELVNRTSRQYALVQPLDDGDTEADRVRWEFTAYVQTFAPAGALDSLYLANVTLRCTGAVTMPGAGTEYPGAAGDGSGYPLT